MIYLAWQMTDQTKICPKCGNSYIKKTARGGNYCDNCNKTYSAVLYRLKAEHKVPENHCCDICGKSEDDLNDVFGRFNRTQSKWCLDHDHTSGEFRGYLCRNCNSGLGRFKDDPNLLIKAATYLQDHSGKS